MGTHPLNADCESVLQDLALLSTKLYHYAEHYAERIMDLEDLSLQPSEGISGVLPCPTIQRGTVGRPPYLINKPQIEALIDAGFSYATIARMFGVSERTILRRRLEYGLQIGRSYTNLSDSNLDEIVRTIVQVWKLQAV